MNRQLLRGGFPRLILLLAVPFATIGFFWATRANEVTLFQVALAFGLIFLPWQAYLNWRRFGRPELPLFAYRFHVFPVLRSYHFWGALTITTYTGQGHEVSAEGLTQALAMAFLGVCCLGLGMKVGIGRHLASLISRYLS